MSQKEEKIINRKFKKLKNKKRKNWKKLKKPKLKLPQCSNIHNKFNNNYKLFSNNKLLYKMIRWGLKLKQKSKNFKLNLMLHKDLSIKQIILTELDILLKW